MNKVQIAYYIVLVLLVIVSLFGLMVFGGSLLTGNVGAIFMGLISAAVMIAPYALMTWLLAGYEKCT